MKMHSIALALTGFAGLIPAAHADSLREWGYWDSAPSQQQVQQPSIVRIAAASPAVRQSTSSTGNTAVTVGNLPTAIIQDIQLSTPSTDTGGTPPPNRWFGYAALEFGTPDGAYDTNAYLQTDANWTYGTVPQTFTFRIAGEDMPTITQGTPTDYVNWNYNRDPSSTVTSNVHVNSRIPMPSDVPMTIGHWHKGSQTYYTLVGSVTQPVDMTALTAGPSISYGGRSMGGSEINITVNFNNASWSGTWTAGNTLPSVMSGSASSTPAFSANGTVSGSNIQSTAITGVTNLDTANSFVKGSFYGTGAAALGGLTVIKTDTAQHSDLFVTCKGVSTCPANGSGPF
ncbi:transferrin-binding protein-like solute binding protein [Comamonas aquatica]|jgi:hypothetical protein|uniref:transferrin-binding protein-like solute binding protein n=1 Tax=Comamonas aquatica TaxID=225991 RepID=UPI003D05D5F1